MSLHGKKIVFTGALSMTRAEAAEMAEHAGAQVLSSVSKSVDIVVAGDKPGSKLVVATALGTKVVSEEDFLKLLEEPDLDDVPLSEEELTKLQSHTVTLTCRWCGNEYKQWNDLPDYGTCSVCEIRARPVCPYCKKQPIFITIFVNYYCETCTCFFESPYSERVYYSDHIHISREGRSRCILCGNTLDTPIKQFPGKTLHNMQNNYKADAKHESFKAKEEERKERVYDKWASSLTGKDIEELKKRIAQV